MLDKYAENKERLRKMIESMDVRMKKEKELKEDLSKHMKSSLLVGFSGSGKSFLEIIPRKLSNETISPLKTYQDIYPAGFIFSSLHHSYIKGLHINFIREYDKNIDSSYKDFEDSGDLESIKLLDYFLKSTVELLLEIAEDIHNDRDVRRRLHFGRNVNLYDLIMQDVIYEPLKFGSSVAEKNLKHSTGLNPHIMGLRSKSVLSLILAEMIECIRGGQRLKKCSKCSAYIFVSDKTSHCPYCDNRETKQEMNLRKQITRLEDQGYFGRKLQEKVKAYMEKRYFTKEEIEEKLSTLEGGK